MSNLRGEAEASKRETWRVEQGYFDCPIYEGHHRGRNWAAVVRRDLTSPGGLRRAWLERARGGHGFYAVPAKGSYIEIGADYYTSGGHKQPHRRYFQVLSVTDGKIVLREVELSEIPRVRSVGDTEGQD